MSRSLRAVIVEDSDRDFALLLAALAEGGFDPEIRRATSAWSMREALESGPCDIAIADYTMPRFSGPEAIALVQDLGLDLPVIIVSGTIDEDLAVSCLLLGATDYVMKRRVERLAPAVDRALRESEERRSRLRAEDALRTSEERYRELVENANDVVFTADLRGNFTSLNRAGEEISGYDREQVRQMNMADVLTAEGYETAQAMLLQKLAEGVPTQYELELIARDGRHVPLEVSTRLIFHEGKPIGTQGIARDITERRRAEEELRSRERKQAAVARIGHQALADPELDPLFRASIEWVTETLAVEYVSILRDDPGDNRLVGLAGIGWEPGVMGSTSVGDGTGSQAGFSLLTNAPVIVSDMATETRFIVPSVLREHGVASGMSVIVHGSIRPFGVLSAFSRQVRDYTQDDVLFLQAVANVLGTAIERKRLEDERERHGRELATRVLQAQEEERKHIARELHDETAQTLSVLLAQLDLLEPRIPIDDEELRRGFERVGTLARRALDETRTLSHDLRPTILDDVGLVAALEWLADEHEQAHGIPVDFDAEPESRHLTPELEVAVFRIAQEALTNCGKHARASSVSAELAFPNAHVRLVVRDDGCGFDPTRIPRPSRDGRLGLYGMHERAALLGGHVAIDTTPGRGTTIRVEIPLEPVSHPPLVGASTKTRQ